VEKQKEYLKALLKELYPSEQFSLIEIEDLLLRVRFSNGQDIFILPGMTKEIIHDLIEHAQKNPSVDSPPLEENTEYEPDDWEIEDPSLDIEIPPFDLEEDEENFNIEVYKISEEDKAALEYAKALKVEFQNYELQFNIYKKIIGYGLVVLSIVGPLTVYLTVPILIDYGATKAANQSLQQMIPWHKEIEARFLRLEHDATYKAHEKQLKALQGENTALEKRLKALESK
jgi:hypothetical protein